MTAAATPTPAVLRAREWLAQGPRDSSAHLWPMISMTRPRRPLSQGLDMLGEGLNGWWARARVRRLDWRRATCIMQAAEGLKNFSDAALLHEAGEARAAVIIDRDDASAIDRAFSIGYEAVRREVGFSLHAEQVLGALALAQGCCAELATGEGKTVTAILPAALDAWLGRGFHIVTVNDYLARRDADITRGAFRRLGLRVGVIQEGSTPHERKAAYTADITYAADKQVIFDYLRDRLASPLLPRMSGLLLDSLLHRAGGEDWTGHVVQRGLYAAIVDEADSVLIDEAITPAIISLQAEDSPSPHYAVGAKIAEEMQSGTHYEVETRHRTVRLTDAGRTLLERAAAGLPPFWSGARRREELISQALHAKELYRLNEDYVIKDGAVQIVDRSTGRILVGRQWQLGLHQAVEAKEGIAPKGENTAAARSSYQAFFQKYQRLAGMSGTAHEVRRELWSWYRLPVVRIPTHRPVVRKAAPDSVHTTEEAKLTAAVERVARAHAKGQPVLVGTWSVLTSERMAEMLRARGIDCQVLNANREAEEAAIIAGAGRRGAVTVATNMAGRGTDILLDAESRAAGGLLVVSTERHDEHRVDRQLAGRAGRQGDPGAVHAFVSLEDRLIAQHGLSPLVWAVRGTAGPLRRLVARMLWWLSQRNASRRWVVIRAEASRADAWLEMSMQQVAR